MASEGSFGNRPEAAEASQAMAATLETQRSPEGDVFAERLIGQRASRQPFETRNCRPVSCKGLPCFQNLKYSCFMHRIGDEMLSVDTKGQSSNIPEPARGQGGEDPGAGRPPRGWKRNGV